MLACRRVDEHVGHRANEWCRHDLRAARPEYPRERRLGANPVAWLSVQALHHAAGLGADARLLCRQDLTVRDQRPDRLRHDRGRRCRLLSSHHHDERENQ